MPVRLGVAVGAVGLAVALAACGGSDYRYVNNSSDHVFFKVPKDYELFKIQAAEPDGRLAPMDTGTALPWHVVFDSSPEPSETNADATAPTDVVGQALVIPISQTQGDQLSSKDLRSFFLGSDPLDMAQSDANVEIVTYEPIAFDGYRGSRVVLNYKQGDVWTTYDQTTFLDPTATKAYLFDVRCESTCFEEHQNAIKQIVDSWQVKT
jgi:hypothetical protein